MLHPLGSRSLAHAGRVQLPSDLSALLQRDYLHVGSTARIEAGSELLHDLGQLLIFGNAQPELSLYRQRWLRAGDLTALNLRLVRPQPAPRLRSHRRNAWLSFLTGLAAGAGLQQNGRLTASGWTWLRTAPTEQFAVLWSAWRSMPDEARAQFNLASASFGEVGLAELLRCLSEQGAAFSSTQLADQFAGATAMPAAYFGARYPALGDLTAAVRKLLVTELTYWGIVHCTPNVPPARRSFVVTSFGKQLLANLPAAADLVSDAGTTYSIESRADGIYVLASGRHPEWIQATLALFADFVTPEACGLEQHVGDHAYRLDAQSIGRAAVYGNRLPALYRAIQMGGARFSPDQQRLLAAWAERSGQVQLRTAVLLETQAPAILAELLQEQAINHAIGRVLRPTIATVTGPLGQLVKTIGDAGYGVTLPRADTLHTEGNHKRSARSRSVDGQGAALWLAGMVYAEIGRFAPLPMSPPYAALARLYAQMSPGERAAVEGQLEQVKADLLRWLDHFAFTPPAEPTDPEAWLPPLHDALAAGKLLELEYFAATRNVVERYVVEPYWLEEHEGVLYLRGDPGTGRSESIVFRLDRIRSLRPLTVSGGIDAGE